MRDHVSNACLTDILRRSGCRHLVHTCTWLIVAHRHARTSSHPAERLNLCLSGKELSSGSGAMLRTTALVCCPENRVTMATSEERLEQLERSLQQAGSALQAANYRIATLESAAGATTLTATTPSASMVDMRVLGKHPNFAGDEASWKSWSFVILSLFAAVSPELRARTVREYGRQGWQGQSRVHKDKKCFYCDKIGHVRADCRKKKRADKERERTVAQNSLTSSPDATSPPEQTNVTTSTSGASASSLRQLTVPSHVSDEEDHSPMRFFALNAGLHVDRVMVDSGAAHSDCPFDYANEHEIRELFDHHGEKLVPYTAQDTVMGITYQVTDVEGPVAAVSSKNDGGMTAVFFTTRSMGLR